MRATYEGYRRGLRARAAGGACACAPQLPVVEKADFSVLSRTGSSPPGGALSPEGSTSHAPPSDLSSSGAGHLTPDRRAGRSSPSGLCDRPAF
jgi:hypothetical protein